MFILFAASAFRGLSSIYVFSYFPFGFEGRIWDLIVSVPDHCLSFYFLYINLSSLLDIILLNVTIFLNLSTSCSNVFNRKSSNVSHSKRK